MRRALLFALAAAAVALPAAGQIAPAAFPHILVIVLDAFFAVFFTAIGFT